MKFRIDRCVAECWYFEWVIDQLSRHHNLLQLRRRGWRRLHSAGMYSSTPANAFWSSASVNFPKNGLWRR